MKIGKFSAVSLLAVVPLILLTADPASAATPTYYPYGPQQNVSKQTLVDGGWTLCWSGGYGETDSLSNIYASCTGDYILYAGGLTGADSYMLLAAAPKADVFAQTGYNQVTESNGTFWYLEPNQSMGFAPNATISQSSADVYDTSDPLRLSWHTGYCGADMICGGWRIGSVVGLNGNNNYTRAIWQSGGGGFVAQPAVSQEEYDSLQAQYDALVADHNLLQADLAALTESYNMLDAEYQGYIQSTDIVINDYIVTLAEHVAVIDGQTVVIEEQSMAISGYISKIDSLNSSIAEKDAAISDLSAKLSSANETIAMLQAALDDANGTIKSTQDQLTEALGNLAKSKSDYELEKAKSADLGKQLAAAQARIKELETKLSDVTAKLEAMTSKQETTQKQLDDAKAEIDTLLKQLSDANATIAEQKNKLDQIQALSSEEDVEQNLALAEELTTVAVAIFATAEKDSEEYELALEMLAVAAIADDPDLPEELAALPVVGAVAGEILNVMNDLGNIGADIAPEQRERAEEIVVASVIAGNIAVSAGASAPSGGARRKV